MGNPTESSGPLTLRTVYGMARNRLCSLPNTRGTRTKMHGKNSCRRGASCESICTSTSNISALTCKWGHRCTPYPKQTNLADHLRRACYHKSETKENIWKHIELYNARTHEWDSNTVPINRKNADNDRLQGEVDYKSIKFGPVLAHSFEINEEIIHSIMRKIFMHVH